MDLNREEEFSKIIEEIINCNRCPELIKYIREVAIKKKKQYRSEKYWGRPVPPFGDLNAELVILGLAPAAHGGNRTGRMFTGDSSGDFLIKTLYKFGFSNQSFSINNNDGLKLINCYITASIKCAPPGNKPTKSELENCSVYLIREFSLLRKCKCIVILGRTAFDNFFNLFKRIYGYEVKRPKFYHGAILKYEKTPYIILSYHPSRQNTQTKKLTQEMFDEVFKKAKEIIENK